MRGGVTTEVIAEVRSRINLVEIVSEQVVLSRSGKDFKACCPFHQEKSPSFFVVPDKGIFKCFGCGESGDVFAFLKKTKNMDFIDSVRELAHRCGVPLVETVEQKQEQDKKSFIYYLYEQACQYYRRLLDDATDGGIGRQYLEKRGIPEEIIQKFQLGYAPQAGGLFRYLTETTKAAPQTLVEAGLIRQYEDSHNYFDFFRHRLLIPVCDEKGRVIAFGGRAMSPEDKVKYRNSPENPIYTKGNHLFGFNLAKDAIKERDAVIVVEGFFDVITAHQFGFTNTVATQGTALTEVQAKLLVRQTESKRVLLSFDADAAGEKAVERGAETLVKLAGDMGLKLRVIEIPGGKDPDECLRSPDGPAQFAAAVENAPAFIDYQLKHAIAAIDIATHSGKIDAAAKLVPILAQIPNAVARRQYAEVWAAKIGVLETDLLSDVRSAAKVDQSKNTPQSKPRDPIRFNPKRSAVKSGTIEAEEQLLALCLSSRDNYDFVMAGIADWDFFTPSHQAIKQAIEGVGPQFNNVEDLRSRLLDRLGPEEEASTALVEIILRVDELVKQNSPVEILVTQFKGRLLKERLDRALTRQTLILRSCENDSDSDAVMCKINQLNQLRKVAESLASSTEELEDLRRQIEELEPTTQLETTSEQR